MGKILTLIIVVGVVIMMTSLVSADITVEVYEADGNTPFDDRDIMVGEKLTIVINSDVNDYWSGGLFISGNHRSLATLSGRDNDPNTRDYELSHYEAAGELAKVTGWQDSSIWGFDLYTSDINDVNFTANDWFIIDYEADAVGDCNVGFYDYNISWSDPNYDLYFTHIPTRDLDPDGSVDFNDFAVLASEWFEDDCNVPNWCKGSDLDLDGDVDVNDLGLFTAYWLWTDTESQQAKAGGGGGGAAPESGGGSTRTYYYTLTVGKNAKEYDYTTITDAVAAMKKNNLDDSHFGLIEVYDGTYVESIGGPVFEDDKLWLPKYCDLKGMGEKPEDVLIQYPLDSLINPYIIAAKGDNIISNLKVYSNLGTKNGVYLVEDGQLIGCIVETIHQSVLGGTGLVVADSTIKSMFGSCIQASDTFSITGCNLYPRGYSSNVEVPKGILAMGSGDINNVTISSTITSSYEYEGAGLTGIHLKHNASEVVNIANVNITLTLSSVYNSQQTAALRVCGIMNGRVWSSPNTYYSGQAFVRDCYVSVSGIETIDEQKRAGADIMVDGVCIRGGGSIEIAGDTTIVTNRTAVGKDDVGYEYSLNNENGVLAVDSKTVTYDDTITNGTITFIK